MKKSETIKSKNDFSFLLKNGKFIKTNEYIVYYRDNDINKMRFGIAISSKIGNAVTRNKLKRQTREIINTLKSSFKNGKDYIIMIRKGCLSTSFRSRVESLENRLKEIL